MARDLVRASSGIVSQDLTWIYYPDSQALKMAVPVMVTLSLFTEATHYPAGVIKPGTLLGKVTVGGAIGPLVADESNGQETPIGVVYSGGVVKRDPITGDVYDTTLEVAMIPAEVEFHVIVANLPGLLNAAAAADPPTASELPTGWSAMDTYV